MKEMIPIKEWSEGQLRLGVPKNRQSSLLGFADDTYIHVLLREPDHVAVDPQTNEVWRKLKQKRSTT